MVWVEIDGRKFLVKFDENGEPLRVYQRKLYGEPHCGGVHNAMYWHAKHHKIGSPRSVIYRVLAAAKAKQCNTPTTSLQILRPATAAT